MAFYGDTVALSTTAASVYALMGSNDRLEYAQQLDILNRDAIVVYGGDSTVTNSGGNAAFVLEENWSWSSDSHDGRTINLKGIYLVSASGTPSVHIAINV